MNNNMTFYKAMLTKKLEKLFKKLEIPRYLLLSVKKDGKYVDRVEKIIDFIINEA